MQTDKWDFIKFKTFAQKSKQQKDKTKRVDENIFKLYIWEGINNQNI